ncbi:hypothetical protein IQ07DRAFT_415385 [Pyrenochaeta sp. DS3sAY3a]|nr:hypothetical protein IQ07DRAFT_415385 [Pyrenochaeta sp. DS3sAY3a]
MNYRGPPNPEEEISKVEEEMIVLRLAAAQKRQELLRKQDELDAKKLIYLSYAYTRAQTQCLAFAAAIHAALPRELRDAIYDHLIPPGLRHHVFEALDATGAPRVSANPLVSVSFFDPRCVLPASVPDRRDVWKSAAYVGEDMAREIAERWYHTGLFILDAEDCLLRKFLATDVWARGNVPGDAIRHLRINARFAADVTVLPKRIASDMRYLSSIGNKSTEIVFYVSWEYRVRRPYLLQAHLPLVQALTVLAGTVLRLRAQGYRKVKVQQGSSEHLGQDVTFVYDVRPSLFVREREEGDDDEESDDEFAGFWRTKGIGEALFPKKKA